MIERELYPFTIHHFQKDQHQKLAYLDEGPRDAEMAIVAVHGNPTWGFYYRSLVRDFSHQYRVCVLDHLGMGLSDPLHTSSYTLDQRLEDMRAWLKSLSLKKVVLVVHDWGGPIGLGSFLLDPFLKPLLKAVVITNTAAYCSQDIPWRIAALKTPFIGRWLMERFNAFAWPATIMASQRRLLPEEKEGYLYPYSSPEKRRGISCFVEDIPLSEKHPSHETLHQIEKSLSFLKTLPVLLLWGKKDFCFHEGFFQRWCAIFFDHPRLQTHLFPEASHYLFEDAWEECGALITSFLEKELYECILPLSKNGEALSPQSGPELPTIH